MKLQVVRNNRAFSRNFPNLNPPCIQLKRWVHFLAYPIFVLNVTDNNNSKKIHIRIKTAVSHMPVCHDEDLFGLSTGEKKGKMFKIFYKFYINFCREYVAD